MQAVDSNAPCHQCCSSALIESLLLLSSCWLIIVVSRHTEDPSRPIACSMQHNLRTAGLHSEMHRSAYSRYRHNFLGAISPTQPSTTQFCLHRVEMYFAYAGQLPPTGASAFRVQVDRRYQCSQSQKCQAALQAGTPSKPGRFTAPLRTAEHDLIACAANVAAASFREPQRQLHDP